MKANYHTHTWRCNHAQGTEEEFIQAAMAQGIQILGFSDHTPYPFPEGYRSRIRMLPEQLGDYTGTLQALEQKYRGQIDLHIGVEAEYFPAFFSDLIALLRDHPVEYMILGQHYIVNEPTGRYTGAATEDVAFLKQYCYQAMEALQTGLYSYMAHPDLIHFVGEPKEYRKYMGELLREIKACGLCAEVNLLGYREGRHYVSRRMLEIAAEENCPVILGIDAHDTAAFADKKAEEEVRSMIADYGLTVWDTVKLRHI